MFDMRALFLIVTIVLDASYQLMQVYSGTLDFRKHDYMITTAYM